MPEPEISVIIPNLHSPIVDRTIESVLSQEIDHPFEVIVVGMDKHGLVDQYPEVRHIQTPEPVGAAAARNLGIRHARGERLFFIDSDCIAQEGWMAALMRGFEQGYPVVGGGVQSPREPFWLLACNLSMFYGELASQKEGERRFMPTLTLAVRREVIEQVGPLDEGLPRGQDIDWTSRMTLAGCRLLFKPSAVVEHHPERQDLASMREMVRKSGYDMIVVRRRYPEIFTIPPLLEQPLAWQLLAPLIASWVTLRILWRTAEVREHPRLIPYIYLQKLSWCKGAAERLREERQGRQ